MKNIYYIIFLAFTILIPTLNASPFKGDVVPKKIGIAVGPSINTTSKYPEDKNSWGSNLFISYTYQVSGLIGTLKKPSWIGLHTGGSYFDTINMFSLKYGLLIRHQVWRSDAHSFSLAYGLGTIQILPTKEKGRQIGHQTQLRAQFVFEQYLYPIFLETMYKIQSLPHLGSDENHDFQTIILGIGLFLSPTPSP